MEERWLCGYCGATFGQPATRYVCDDGAVATLTHLCPRCGCDALEELTPCPACHVGWMRADDHVCDKCHLRLQGDLQRFAHQYSPAELADLDDMLEGNGLEVLT